MLHSKMCQAEDFHPEWIRRASERMKETNKSSAETINICARLWTNNGAANRTLS